ncbi:two-component sensor histidine kinase [Saccharothrix yanglingensis]|uniref:histidine kinase n=1 Tax=Saccharothrix yanglingensis TaxID=659496 RepID=A0ABU0X4I7_9PSEU|nr:two-component sensor histidine kinase [Saccharothrix yanglingensis]
MAAQLWPFAVRDGEYGWWGYAVVVASAVPLLWRREAPLAALVLSLAATGLYDFGGEAPAQPVWYGGIVAMHAVAAHSGRRARVAALVVSIGGTVLLVGPEPAFRTVALLAAAYAMGRAAAASAERVARLARERELEAERAAERERARIARDMHDILSHAVSVMVVQAEAGPVVLRADPTRAEAAFDAIAAAGRDAMTQLRGILAVLEDDDSRAPQPTLDDLPALADQVRAAGVDVGFATGGTPLPLRPDVAVAAYRTTQEALTNVVKHASAGRADVRLDWRDDELVISITDDGRGTAAGHGGRGLIGIRERAAACGGTAHAGPRTDGRGFRVVVRLPA